LLALGRLVCHFGGERVILLLVLGVFALHLIVDELFCDLYWECLFIAEVVCG
jgi:hypothetical protein